jgi:hypothetical protein
MEESRAGEQRQAGPGVAWQNGRSALAVFGLEFLTVNLLLRNY